VVHALGGVNMTTRKPKKIRVARFNEQGIEKFADFLDLKREKPTTPLPNLRTAGLIEEFEIPPGKDGKIEIPVGKLSQAELADHLLDFFESIDIRIEETYGDRGLWSFISYLFFEDHLLKPRLKSNKLVVNDKFILAEGAWGYYRNSLTAMCWIRKLHGRDVGQVLMLSPHTYEFGDSLEQILASPLYQSEQIFELLDDLYLVDDGAGNLSRRPSFLSQRASIPSLRMFKRAIGRLNMTYHLPSLSVGRLKTLLPNTLHEWGSIEDDPLPGADKNTKVGSKKSPIP